MKAKMIISAMLSVLTLFSLIGCTGSEVGPAPEATEPAPATTAAPETDAPADTSFVPEDGIEYSRKLLAVYYDGKWNPGLKMSESDAACVDLVYYMCLNVMGDDQVELSNDKLTPDDISAIKAVNPGVKVLIVLVGDNRDGKNGGREFANAVSNDEKRADLRDAVIGAITEYGFDGIDINWEYPSDAVDRNNEVAFAAVMREALDALGEGYLLTTAISSTNWGFEMHDVLGLCGYSDYINVMTYDHHINDVETLHHTAPKNDGTGKYGDRGYSNEQTTQIFISNGVPAEKLILGCGLYTLEWSDVPEGENHGFNQIGVRVPNHTYHYKELESLCRGGSYKRYWDDTAKAAWFYNAEDHRFLSCDDDESVRVKAELTHKYGNAGLMLFSYYTLKGGTLMESARHWLDGDLEYPASIDWSKYTAGSIK